MLLVLSNDRGYAMNQDYQEILTLMSWNNLSKMLSLGRANTILVLGLSVVLQGCYMQHALAMAVRLGVNDGQYNCAWPDIDDFKGWRRLELSHSKMAQSEQRKK
jgi:hypothetical protein